MILVILFVVLNAIYIAGLLWCILAIRSTTKIGAQVMDIHTDALRKQSAEISALRESTFPKYASAVVALPDPRWAAHDAAVSDALAAKVAENARYGKTPENGTQSRTDRVGVWQVQAMDAVSAYPSVCPSCKSPDPAAMPVVDNGKKLEFKCSDLWHTKRGGGVPMADPETAPFFTQSQPEK